MLDRAAVTTNTRICWRVPEAKCSRPRQCSAAAAADADVRDSSARFDTAGSSARGSLCAELDVEATSVLRCHFKNDPSDAGLSRPQ